VKEAKRKKEVKRIWDKRQGARHKEGRREDV